LFMSSFYALRGTIRSLFSGRDYYHFYYHYHIYCDYSQLIHFFHFATDRGLDSSPAIIGFHSERVLANQKVRVEVVPEREIETRPRSIDVGSLVRPGEIVGGRRKAAGGGGGGISSGGSSSGGTSSGDSGGGSGDTNQTGDVGAWPADAPWSRFRCGRRVGRSG
jgi:uncharacterized membrane protein YgcG